MTICWGEMSQSRTGLSSRKLAVLAVAANLTVCALVGSALLVVRSGNGEAAAAESRPTTAPTTVEPPASSPSSTAAEPTTPSQPTTPAPSTPTSGVPAGFQAVSGPGGITTLIPSGWQAVPRAGQANIQATNPAEPTSFLRYGGSPSPAESLLKIQQDAELAFRPRYAGYQLIALRPGKWRGHESVTWEFEFEADGGRKHVNSVYWRAGGTDYVLYASALVSSWPQMKAIYATALGATKP